MKKTKPLPSQSTLQSLFDYDPALGILIAKPSNICIIIRKIPLNGGRFRAQIDGEKYYVHRLIWKLMTGTDPIEIDHIDGNGMNNRWNNLRNATSAQNNQNRKMLARNKSGVKGVCWESSRHKWRAAIGPQVWVCRFDTLEEAETAIKAKRVELHGEFARSA